MKTLVLMVALMAFLVVPAMSADYTYIDKKGNYRGYVDKGDTRIDFYGRDNMPRGWIDRSSGATYDRHNNFRGWIIDSDNDRD